MSCNRRVVLLYQGKLYPEAFVDFVHRRDAAQCVIHWAQPTKIYRHTHKFGDGPKLINWTVGVIAYQYRPPRNDKDWARAWKERHRIEQGDLPEDVLAPRWKRASVREEEERRVQRRDPQAKCSSARRLKERQRQTFMNSGPPAIQNRHSSPLIVDAAVMSDTLMELDTILTGATLVGSPASPASYSEDRITTVNVDDFLEKIVEDSDSAALSVAMTAIQRAAQNFMDAADEFHVLMYEYCASVEVDTFDVPCSGCFRAGETSIQDAAGEQNSIGMVQALFHIQRMTDLDLRI